MSRIIRLYDDPPLYLQMVLWLAIGLLITATSISASASGLSSARSVAMGGAFTGLASGIDAAKFNPANLGFTDYRRTSLQIAGVGANISNNSFSLDDYNSYTGAFLTDDDKDDILGKIPEEGLKFSADVEASALSLSMGSFALDINGVGVADVNLNKDLIDLVLNGNAIADTISVVGSYSDAVAYASAGLSYGRPLLKIAGREISVGASFKYIHGLAIERVVELEGMAVTGYTGFAGNGKLVAQTATGGKGYSADIGAAVKLSKDYTAGVSIKNIISSITWDNETEEHGYLFDFDSMTFDNADDETLVTSEDYTKSIPSFSTSIPTVMTIGIGRTTGSFIWAVDYEQGFRDEAAGASTKPRLSAGAEIRPLGFLPVRAGYSMGGEQGSSFSFGSGFDFAMFYLDYAAVVGSKFSGGSSKGARLAVSMGLSF